MKFRKIDNTSIDDIVAYAIAYQAKHRNVKIYIGTDSIAIGGYILYVTAIAFRTGREGAHVVYSKERVTSYRTSTGKPDLKTRLIRETQISCDVADQLIDSKAFQPEDLTIEMDYNNIVATVSKSVIPWATSMVVWKNIKFNLKFTDRGKVEEQYAVKAANHICKGSL